MAFHEVARRDVFRRKNTPPTHPPQQPVRKPRNRPTFTPVCLRRGEQRVTTRPIVPISSEGWSTAHRTDYTIPGVEMGNPTEPLTRFQRCPRGWHQSTRQWSQREAKCTQNKSKAPETGARRVSNIKAMQKPPSRGRAEPSGTKESQKNPRKEREETTKPCDSHQRQR